MEVFLRGKGFFDNLVSDKPKPTKTSTPSTTTTIALASLWGEEDMQILSLLLTSTEPSIGPTLLHL